MAFRPTAPDITPSPLSTKAQSFVSRLVLQSQYDCRQEIDTYAHSAMDRGVSLAQINTMIIEVAQVGFGHGAKPDRIQRQIEASLEELETEVNHG